MSNLPQFAEFIQDREAIALPHWQWRSPLCNPD